MADEVGELLGVVKAGEFSDESAWTWRKRAYEGKVSSVKLGRRLLIPKREILRIISENTRPRRTA